MTIRPRSPEMVQDSILALIPAFVRRQRCAPIGGLPQRPTGYFTGRAVLPTEDLHTALGHLSEAGCGFFAADRVLLVGHARDCMIIRRFHPGPSALLQRAFGGGAALLDFLDAAGTQDGETLEGEIPSAHRRLHLEALLARAPAAARAAWDDIARVRAARPHAPRTLRFHRQNRFRWIAEDGQPMPWLLHEIPDTSSFPAETPPRISP